MDEKVIWSNRNAMTENLVVGARKGMRGSWRIWAPLKSKSVVMGNCLDPAFFSTASLSCFAAVF